jgi:translation initiation factor 2B subunit (eIF-2B alpha/beta/delta family)
MPKQVKQQKRPTDVNELAHHLVELSTSTPEAHPVKISADANISAYMSAIGRKGGQIGGKRRLKTMTKAERSKAAAKAARTRWSKRKP